MASAPLAHPRGSPNSGGDCRLSRVQSEEKPYLCYEHSEGSSRCVAADESVREEESDESELQEAHAKLSKGRNGGGLNAALASSPSHLSIYLAAMDKLCRLEGLGTRLHSVISSLTTQFFYKNKKRM